MTKAQKKKAVKREARSRQDFLASLDAPIATIDRLELEAHLKAVKNLGRTPAWAVGLSVMGRA